MDISAILMESIREMESGGLWGDMVWDSPEEAVRRRVNAVVDEVAALDSEQRYEGQLVEFLVDKLNILDDGFLNQVVKAISARGLITPPYVEPDAYYEIDDILENWEVPNISERKAIWRNFPVSVKARELGCADGKDRYAVVLHEENLEQWRKDRSETWDEYQNYETWALARLEHALDRYSHIYTVEPADDALFVIAVDAEEQMPPAKRALDVLRAAGVNWKRDGANHDIVPRGMTADAQSALLVALRACSDCTVEPRTGFLCRVVIGSAATTTPAAAAPVAAAPVAAAPVAVAAPVVAERPLDILSRFPVTWKRAGAVHDIKVHFGKCPRKEIPAMTARLLAALRGCAGCVVSAPVSDEFICRVVIA